MQKYMCVCGECTYSEGLFDLDGQLLPLQSLDDDFHIIKKIITRKLGWQIIELISSLINKEEITLNYRREKRKQTIWDLLEKNHANCEVRTHADLRLVDLKSTPLNHSGKLAMLPTCLGEAPLSPRLTQCQVKDQ